jgi:hypothetical protein
VTATGSASGATASAPLTVTGNPQLSLSRTSISVGGSYTATATGFLPHESVSFVWSGPTPGASGAFADVSGNTTMTVADEEAVPGTYTMFARGAVSGDSATVTLVVVG